MQASNLDDIAPVIGYTATRILAAWYAGRALYVPRFARDDHPLARLIGMSALRALCAEYSSMQICIPPESEDDRFRRDRRVALLLLAGQTCSEIGEQLGLSTRRVEQIRAELLSRGWLEYASAGRRRAPLREPAEPLT